MGVTDGAYFCERKDHNRMYRVSEAEVAAAADEVVLDRLDSVDVG